MPESAAARAGWGVCHDDLAVKSLAELPRSARYALSDVQLALERDPSAFPGRVSRLSADGRLRIYRHPKPPLQVIFEVDEERRVLTVKHYVMPEVERVKQVFVSYSHLDTRWLERVKPFLLPLEDAGLLRLWDDHAIESGEDWLQEITERLEAAQVAVFLVTQNFLTSKFIRSKELPALLHAAHDRGCAIFWISVSSATVEGSPLARFQAANSPEQPLDTLDEPHQNKVLVDIVTKLRRVVDPD